MNTDKSVENTTEAAEEAGEEMDRDDATPVGESASTEGAKNHNVLQLLPVHAAPTLGGKGKQGNALKVERRVGRPRKVERMPTTSDLQYHAAISEEKARFIDSDAVVQATQGSSDAAQVLKLIRSEVAKEAAALHFQRIENEKFGKDTAQTSTRRIDALTKIANIELEIKKLGSDAIDLHGEKFQKVFALWIEMMREVASDTLSPELIDLFFNRFSTKIEGWEERAADAVR
jgi:hypothetical protein